MKVLTLLFLLLWSVSVNAQGEKTASEFRLLMEERLQEVRNPFESERKVLHEGFSVRVEAIGKEFQEQGDLENALKARDELKTLSESGDVGSDDFPALKDLREIFVRKRDEIAGREREEIVNLRKGFVRGLENRRSELTRAGKIEDALEFEKLVKEQQKEIDHLQSGGARTMELGSLKIAGEGEADSILAKWDPRNNLVSQAKVTASSAHPKREEPEAVQRRSRPKEIEKLEELDAWCIDGSEGKGPTGWIEFAWDEPVLAKTILLINRPKANNADVWTLGEVSVNGKLLTEFTEFKRAQVALLDLKEAFVFKQLKIECKQGTWSPGLYSVEVYP